MFVLINWNHIMMYFIPKFVIQIIYLDHNLLVHDFNLSGVLDGT